MTSKAIFNFCVVALIQAISVQFAEAYNSLTGIDLLGLRSACNPYSALFSEPTFHNSYGFGPYYDDAIWPNSFGPFSEIWGPNGFGPGFADFSEFNNGMKFVVSSASPVTPSGITIISENVYEGPVAVSGSVPFLGAVTLEGTLPTIGGGAVEYGCGNGKIDIMAEELVDFDGFGNPFFDGLARPAFDGLARPYVYESLFGPCGYDDLVGPYGYSDIVGPSYGRYGPCGFNGFYY